VSWLPILDEWDGAGAQVTLYGCQDWGFNLFHASAFETVPRVCGLQRVFIEAWKRERLTFFHINHKYLQMGDPRGLKEMEAYLDAQRKFLAQFVTTKTLWTAGETERWRGCERPGCEWAPVLLGRRWARR
jgi:hypothetical protein